MCVHVYEYMNILKTVQNVSNTIKESVRSYPEMSTIQRINKVSVISSSLNIKYNHIFSCDL